MVDTLDLSTASEAELERLSRVQGGIKLALTELGRRRLLLLGGKSDEIDSQAHARVLEKTMQLIGFRGALKTKLVQAKRMV
jgi:hypothetical protein